MSFTSEDTQSTTLKTLSPYADPVDYQKSLSMTFGKVHYLLSVCFVEPEFLIPQDIINEVYLLGFRSVKLLDECPRLEEDFAHFYATRIPVLFNQIFSHTHICDVKNTDIEVYWALLKLSRLLFSSRIRKKEPDAMCPFSVPVSYTISLLQNLQAAVFRYPAKEATPELDEDPKPCVFFRGRTRRGFVIDEKLKVVNACVETILDTVQLHPELFAHFHNLLVQQPVYFSSELWRHQLQCLSDRLDGCGWSDEVGLMRAYRNRAMNEFDNIARHISLPPLVEDQYSETAVKYPKSPIKYKPYRIGQSDPELLSCVNHPLTIASDVDSTPRDFVPGFRFRVRIWVSHLKKRLREK